MPIEAIDLVKHSCSPLECLNFLLFIAGVSVMDMRTHVMNTMVQVALAKTTLRPPPVSAALKMTGKTATGNRYAHSGDYFNMEEGFHLLLATHRRWPVSQYILGLFVFALIQAILRIEKRVCSLFYSLLDFAQIVHLCSSI